MQAWTSLELTPEVVARTIVHVGRPNKTSTPGAYRKAFFERVRTARKLFTDNAADMASALGVQAGTYNRYETRTMLPHHLIPRFCELTGVPVEWLMFGPTGGRHPRHAPSPHEPTAS